MNQLEAMRDTIALMERGLVEAEKRHQLIPNLDVSLMPPHLRDMLAIMESGVNPQDTERDFGEAKMGRWLGWAQAAVAALGLATLEDMKQINKSHQDRA